MKRKFLTRLLVALLVVLTVAGDVYAKAGRKTLTIVGKVTRVSDGDTIWVHTGLSRHKVRLSRIDAPESNQSYGKESAAHLKFLVFGKEDGQRRVTLYPINTLFGQNAFWTILQLWKGSLAVRKEVAVSTMHVGSARLFIALRS